MLEQNFCNMDLRDRDKGTNNGSGVKTSVLIELLIHFPELILTHLLYAFKTNPETLIL